MNQDNSANAPAYADPSNQHIAPDASEVSNINDMGPNPKRVRKKKKKVEMACVYCRRSHMICDDARPCLRCIKRGIGHLCHDEPTPGRQKRKSDGKPGSETAGTLSPPSNLRAIGNSPPTENLPAQVAAQPQVMPMQLIPQVPQQIPPQVTPQVASVPRNGALSKSLPFNQEPLFYSEHAGSEFSSLNDFLSMIDDPELVNGALNDATTNQDALMTFSLGPELASNSTTNFNSLLAFSPTNTLMATFDQNLQVKQEPQTQAYVDRKAENQGQFSKRNSTTNFAETGNGHQPVISDSARDKFFLTAADPTTEISPEERLKQVIKAKLEAGLLQPYNYAKGYARLQSYMDNYMNQLSRQRILKPLSIFRPAFRAIARTLKDVDLVLVEESFERMLLDYDRVFTSMAIPACLWRRTGEIYRGNKEFASLVGVTTDDLKDGKLAIYELMSEESAVNFWEKYGAIAFDKGQKAVLTSCNLRTKDGFKRKSCCFSFTIRRDRYNIPSCIVGNFIPIDP